MHISTAGAGGRRHSKTATCRALVSAATQGDTHAVDNLLAHGADVANDADDAARGLASEDDAATLHARRASLSIPPRALVQAAAVGDVRAVGDLLARGADPNAPDANGVVPLHAACERDRLEVVKQLLKAGASPNRVHPNGSTCLHLAVATGGEIEVRLLIDGQADVNALDASGRSALHLAAAHQRDQLVDLLLENGADASALGRLETTHAIEEKLRDAATLSYHAPAEVASRRRRSVDQSRRAGEATPGAARALSASSTPATTTIRAVTSTRTATSKHAVPITPLPATHADPIVDHRRARRERPVLPAEPEAAAQMARRGSSESEARASSRRRRRASQQAGERGASEQARMEDDPREPALFDLVLVYLRDSDTSYVSAAALAEQRAPRRAALVKRLRGCGLRVKKTYAQDNNGSAKTLIVVGATRTRMLAAAESSAMRLRLRPEFGGGYSTFTRALAWHFETASDVGGEAGEAAAEATHDRFELSSAQRAFLIDRLISMRAADGGAGIDLGACFKRTDLERRFLLHDEAERLALELRVGEGSMIGAVPLPLRQIEGYLGAEYGFYFAFLHLLTSSLWLPAGLGTVLFAVEEGFGKGGTSRVVWLMPAYAFLLMLWSTGFVEMWKQRQSELAAEWDLSAQHANAHARPEFHGEYRRGLYSEAGEFVRIHEDELPADAEAPLLETAPRSLPRVRGFWASTVVLCFLGATIVGTLGLVVFRFLASKTMGVRGTFGAAIAMAFFVEAMSFAYDRAAHALTAWENHRTYEAHRDSLIIKLFVFSFFNKTFALFYIAFAKGRRTFLFGASYEEQCTDMSGLPATDCMDELRTQVLMLIVVHATVSQLLEVLKPYLAFRSAQAKEAVREKAGKSREARAVRQLKLSAATPLFTEYNELLLDFAISTLFATALPLAPLLVLVNNFFEMKADMTKVLRLNERGTVQSVRGIGLWLPIFEAIGYAAVFTNLGILVFTSKHLDRIVVLSDTQKLLVLVVLEHAVLLAKLGLSMGFSDVPARVLNALAHRDFLAGAWVRGERINAQLDTFELALSTREGTADAADSEPGSHDELDEDEQRQTAAEDKSLALATGTPEARAAAARRVERASTVSAAAAPAHAPLNRSDDGAAAGAHAARAARGSAGGGAWTPFRALLRRDTARQCTDVIFVLLGLLAIGGFILLSTISFTAGDVHRLSAGTDHQYDLCARNNAGAPPLDTRIVSHSANSLRFAPFAPAGRDLTDRPFLFYADPLNALGICVRACPAPAEPLFGFDARNLVCTDECAGGSEEELLRRFGRCCFPAYATVKADGYCRPASDLTEASLRAAFDLASIRVGDGSSDSARSFWPTDAALDSVRARLDSPARGFVRIAAEMRRFATLTAASVGGALVVSALLSAAFLSAPVAATYGSLALSVASLGGLGFVLWRTGDAELRAHAAAPRSVAYANGFILAACAYALWALAGCCALAALRVSASMRGRLAALMAEVACVLRDARALLLVPLLGVGGSALLLVWWFYVATYLLSTGLFDISGQGYPLPRFDSAVVRSFAALAFVGVFLAFCVQHACRMAVAGLAALWYFHRKVDMRARADAAAAKTARGGARPRPADASRPAGMSARAMARLPRAYDTRDETAELPTLSLRSALWLIGRYHAGSIALGALVAPFLWPLKLLLWAGRACGLSARADADEAERPPRGCLAALASSCARASCFDFARVLSVDAYVYVFALDRGLVPAARITWAALLAQPAAVTAARHTTDLCFYAIKFATASVTGASVGVVLVLGMGVGPDGSSSASILLPMAWTFILSYMTVSQFVLVYEAVLSGLVVSFSLDASNNPREQRHTTSALLAVLSESNDGYQVAAADEEIGGRAQAYHAAEPRAAPLTSPGGDPGRKNRSALDAASVKGGAPDQQTPGGVPWLEA